MKLSPPSRRLARALVSLCMGAVLATAARAAEYIKLADGTILDGDAIAYDEGTRTLTFRLHTGREVKHTLDELDERSVYLVEHSRVDKNDAKGQIRIGNFARDIGLYAHAARHYRNAVAADPSVQAEVDEEVAVLKREAAAWGMQNARSAIERGDIHEAEKWLLKVIEKLPDMPEASEAQKLLDQYYQRTMAPMASARSTVGAPENLLETDLKKGEQYFDSMVEKTRKGLTEDRSGSRAVKQWGSAIKDGERALKEIDEVEKGSSDPATMEFLKLARKTVEDQLIEVHLHLASLYMTRTSYDKAMSEANEALALDSQNLRALAMRSRIENAAGGGWRWW